MSSKFLSRLSVAIIMCFILGMWLSCKHHPFLPDNITGIDTTGNHGDTLAHNPPVTGIPCSSDSFYFVNTILPLIQANCAGAGCHDALTHSEGLNLTTYAGIMSIVKAGSPNESRLYSVLLSKGEGKMPPSTQAALTQPEIQEINNWIAQGALNNHCDACDTANMSYKTNIIPILQSECYSCHTGAIPVSGINLSTYSALLPYIQNGQVKGNINGLTGYNLMPQGGKMPQCYINQIDAWIQKGAPDN